MILSLVLAYLLGSIPFGLLVGYAVKKVDIREHGSKNIGATNVFRVVGKKWGILVLFLDAFKGWLACKLPEIIFDAQLGVEQELLLAVAAIAGHTFSVWLKFKGGKGVATSLGVFLAVAWLPTLTAFGFWIIIFSFFRIISVASLAAGAIYPVLVFLFERNQPGFMWLMILSVILCLFMFYTHRANIGRILKGEEKKLI
ncbi:MAG TPA: acyl-phosphate glycerol 3-phosphate acyltransferase [Candidatus Omnitrophica bacterium]|nr:acyl-phosphate glycerol 3-phosphate acyltransferase [Candidatus Omnitrophota bacterium]